jgi:hypothetical protein
MTPKTPTAGAKLRADLDTALAHASEEAGRALEFDEAERHVIDQVVEAANIAEQMHAFTAPSWPAPSHARPLW